MHHLVSTGIVAWGLQTSAQFTPGLVCDIDWPFCRTVFSTATVIKLLLMWVGANTLKATFPNNKKKCLLPFLAKLVQPVGVHIKWALSWIWWITDSIYRLMLYSDSKLCKTNGNGVRKSWVCLAISLCGDKQFAARHIGKLSYYRLCGTKPSNVLAAFKLWVTRLQLHTYIWMIVMLCSQF